MFTTEELEPHYRLCDYDEIGDLQTNGFTKNLDKIEFFTETHPFLFYLDGFLHGLEYITILHGYYRKDNYTLKLFIDDTSMYCKIGIWIAWNQYVQRFTSFQDECQVSLYETYCLELYEMNESEHDCREFYKWFVGGLIDDKL